jgi:hypothetical protein
VLGLQEALAGGRVLWTGSEAAVRAHFDFDDIQCLRGSDSERAGRVCMWA